MLDHHRNRLRRDLEDHLQEDSDGRSIFQRAVNMQNHKIQNLGLCTSSSDAANKRYVDSAGIISVLNLAASVYIDGYSKEWAECMYLVERGGEVKLNSNKVVQLFNWTLSHLDAEQTNNSLRPTLASEKHAKRFFISFNGSQRMTSAIDLNPASGANDRVHVFHVFRVHSHNGSNQHFRNGLFGHDDGGWDKFLVYKPTTHNLLISGIQNAGNVLVTSSDWKTKADASELNKWICLSCHWNVPEGENGSSPLGEWKESERIHRSYIQRFH